MAYLLDTNVLPRFLHRKDPQHQLVRQALRTLRSQNEPHCFTSQNLAEFWNVCTRPATARGGLGMTVEQTDRRARWPEHLFTLLPDTPAIHVEWRQLLVVHAVSGVQVHDARLVAAMRVHGVDRLLTLNVADFQRYTGIRVVHPNSI